jgi:hypothetical protein
MHYFSFNPIVVLRIPRPTPMLQLLRDINLLTEVVAQTRLCPTQQDQNRSFSFVLLFFKQLPLHILICNIYPCIEEPAKNDILNAIQNHTTLLSRQ